jgi:ABC-type branched-subunit amino acid transport system substrate-binding protein
MSRGLSILALAALAAASGGLAPAAAQSKDPIKLGVLTIQTGRNAIAGSALTVGAQMAEKDINAAGGIAGRPLQLVMADEQGDPTLAVGEAKRLAYEAKVDLVIGPLLSPSVMATLPIFNDVKVAQISNATTLDVTPQAGPYHFSIAYTVVSSVLAQIDFAERVLKAKKVAFLGDQSVTSKIDIETLNKELPRRNMQLVAQQIYQIGDTDFTPELLTLRKADPEVIVLYVNDGQTAGNILKNAFDLGWHPKTVTSSGMALWPDQVIKVAGPQAYENAYAVQNKAYTYCPDDPLGSGAIPKFTAKLKAFATNAPSDLSPAIVAWYYDALYIFKAAIEGSGGKTDGPTVANWIEENGQKLHLLDGDPEVSKTDHFMFSTKSLTMVAHAENKRADGLQLRADCAK